MATKPIIGFSAGTEVMSKPAGGSPSCPPGLEYLTQLDQLIVHQQLELMEVITGFDFKNRYQIKNSLGQQVYFAYEESTFCCRCWCQSHREFSMTVTDNTGLEVIRMHRPWKYCSSAGSCCCADAADCCSDEITVESPPGQVIAKIRHAGSKWLPHLEVKDATDQVVFHIWGPSCCLCQTVCCTEDLDFKIYTKDGETEVGNIAKQWAGAVRECFTKVSHFGIQFPIDLDVKMKAALIGATMLIEYLYIESQHDGENQ
ncbi:phospholipid scramblase 1-like [Amphiura filiformis]|uniref:phospholipid scramblase 1-like n=1 Tax=Amphiura filiformis TaxID=82378 RepID=UPI003B21B820